MHIRRSVYQVGKQHGVKPPKTNSGARGIMLPARLLDVLRAHRAAQAQWRRDIDPTWADSDPALYAEPVPCHVFQRVPGGYLLPTTVSHAIGDIFKRAGLPPGLGPHGVAPHRREPCDGVEFRSARGGRSARPCQRHHHA